MKKLFFISLVASFSCLLSLATTAGETSLAEKTLELVTTTPNITYSTKKHKPVNFKSVSKLESIVKKAQHITQGAGILGKDIKTVIHKDLIGLQYTKKW